MVCPEEAFKSESLENGYAVSLTKEGTTEALEIRDRLMKDYINDALSCKDDAGKSVMNALTESWIATMLQKGVTSKDMATIMKLKGEDIQKSQSVQVKMKAEVDAKNSTIDFLKNTMGNK